MMERRGSETANSVVVICLASLPFLGIGIFLTLIGLKIVPSAAKNIQAPYWVITVCGLMFGAGGPFLWSLAWKQFQARRRQALAQKNHRNEPALADYPWDPRGYDPHRWISIAKKFAALGFAALFLAPFNWWAWLVPGPWPLKIVVSLFDLLFVLLFISDVMAAGRAFKFGESRIEFARFPLRLSAPISIRWLTPSGIDRAVNGTFTLRCIKEWCESTGTGQDRSTCIVHEEQWSGNWSLSQPENLPSGKILPLEFSPPAEAPITCLSAERPVFWEFEVKLGLPGLDFRETYLVPVY